MKTLVIVFIILLAVLGVAVGIFLQGYLSDNKNDSLNQTNTSVNVTVDNQTTDNKNQNNLISAEKAISIVKQNAGPSKHVRFSAKLIQNGNNPYYLISVYSTNRNSSMYGENIGGGKVDARTGEFLGGMG
jgi:hypothetical protein